MQEFVGSNHTKGTKIWFSHFTILEVKREELFCQTNIKLLKLIKRYSIISKNKIIMIKCFFLHSLNSAFEQYYNS